MDIATVVTTATLTGVINLVISGIFGGILKQWVRSRDTKILSLEGKVQKLEGEKIVRIERTVDERFSKSAASRKEIHQEVAALKTEFVSKRDCEKQHDLMRREFEKFSGAVVDLGRIEEKLGSTANFVSDVNERVIAQARDLAHLEGKQR